MSDSLYIPKMVPLKVFDRDLKNWVSFEITEFVLNQRIQFMRMVSDVMKSVYTDHKDENLKPEEITSLFIREAGEKLVDVYRLVLGQDKDWLLKNITPRNEVEIIQAIVEVNDLPFLLGQIKKLVGPMARKT